METAQPAQRQSKAGERKIKMGITRLRSRIRLQKYDTFFNAYTCAAMAELFYPATKAPRHEEKI